MTAAWRKHGIKSYQRYKRSWRRKHGSGGGGGGVSKWR
jgi:hypothetical protein